MKKYDCLSLFSGGLDSILAAKLLQAQGLKVLGLHCVSPFFGHEERIPYWQQEYGLPIQPVDVGEEFVRMLLSGPCWGVGKVLNPCVDCKILMLGRARELLPHYGASFLATGEVLGQRPMSQRRDTLNIIQRDAGVKGLLLRPLCAGRLDPTPMEESGLVDRERLGSLSGRGRKGQLELAAAFGIRDVPTPAGGCLLTETESSKRFWPVIAHLDAPRPDDFELANVGRELWREGHRLVVGRNKADNDSLLRLVRPSTDLVFRLKDFPGPIAVGRQTGRPWNGEIREQAAAATASFSPKAVRAGATVTVRIADRDGTEEITVQPRDPTTMGWHEPTWEEAEPEKKKRFGQVSD